MSEPPTTTKASHRTIAGHEALVELSVLPRQNAKSRTVVCRSSFFPDENKFSYNHT